MSDAIFRLAPTQNSPRRDEQEVKVDQVRGRVLSLSAQCLPLWHGALTCLWLRERLTGCPPFPPLGPGLQCKIVVVDQRLAPNADKE